MCSKPLTRANKHFLKRLATIDGQQDGPCWLTESVSSKTACFQQLLAQQEENTYSKNHQLSERKTTFLPPLICIAKFMIGYL